MPHAGGTVGTGVQLTMPAYNGRVRGIAAFSASWHQPASIANRHTLVVTTSKQDLSAKPVRSWRVRPVRTLSRSIRGKASALRVFMGKGVVLNWHPHDIHARFACSTVPGSLGLFFREPTCPLERADTSFCDRGVPVTSRYSLLDSDFWDTERSVQILYARHCFGCKKSEDRLSSAGGTTRGRGKNDVFCGVTSEGGGGWNHHLGHNTIYQSPQRNAPLAHSRNRSLTKRHHHSRCCHFTNPAGISILPPPIARRSTPPPQ
jgi:hypothetical protein